MRKKTLFEVICFALLSTQIGVAGAAPNSKIAKTVGAYKMTKSSDDTFAKKLLSATILGRAGNIVVCPFSAANALTVLANGAAGTTKKQILSTISEAQSLLTLNQRYANFVKSKTVGQREKNASEFEIANAIFSDKSTHFKPDFLELCKRDFDMDMRNSGAAPISVATINQWCREKTHGRIASIIDEPLSSEGFALMNAVYFKGLWLMPFSRDATKSEIFHSETGDVTIPMMRNVMTLKYAKQTGFSLVELPYEDKRVSLFVLLPDTDNGLNQMEKALLTQSFEKIFDSPVDTEVDIGLPRFKIESKHDLKSPFFNLGMTDAFSAEKADFSNSTENKVAVESIVQKVFFEVDEKGTEAAAVTAPRSNGTGGQPAEVKVVHFHVNHPFLAVMVDKLSKEILFVAKVAKP